MEPTEYEPEHPKTADPNRTLAEGRARETSAEGTATVRSDPARPEPVEPFHAEMRTSPQVSGYRIVRKLGQGTYGEVWLAEDEKTGIRVAIKFFARGTGQQWQLLQAEVQQLALLHADPGIVRLRDVAPDAHPPHYIMTYAEGGALADRLKEGPLPPGDALRLFRQVTQALAYVHAKGIRHCDLKPGNVLLDARGRAMLADFGQAHLSDDASPALGTYFYMAPEQASLAPQIPDTRWDVYGLGALLYAMLTGRPPREDSTLRDELAGTTKLSHRLERYREALVKAPKPTAHRKIVDRGLSRILEGCLQVDPQKRFRDAGSVLEALDRRKQKRRDRPLLLFGLLTPLLLVLGMVLLGVALANIAVRRAQGALAHQLQESDRISAQMVANVVSQKLDYRAKLLERHANYPSDRDRLLPVLRRKEAAVDPAERHRLEGILKDFHGKQGPNEILWRWTLADRNGWMVADYPPEPELHGRNWAWRDWFNGTGDKRGQEGQPFAMLTRPHFSQPYVGVGIGKDGEPDPLILSLSVPIRDPDSGEIAGLLVGTMNLDGLYDGLSPREMENDSGFVALFNEQGQCLLHRATAAAAPPKDGNPRTWLKDFPLAGSQLSDKGGRLDEYPDPVDGRTYLGGYARLDGNYPWVAVVQHEKGPALQPVQDLVQWLVSFAACGLLLVSLASGCLWSWLLWTVRREGRSIHGH